MMGKLVHLRAVETFLRGRKDLFWTLQGFLLHQMAVWKSWEGKRNKAHSTQ